MPLFGSLSLNTRVYTTQVRPMHVLHDAHSAEAPSTTKRRRSKRFAPVGAARKVGDPLLQL